MSALIPTAESYESVFGMPPAALIDLHDAAQPESWRPLTHYRIAHDLGPSHTVEKLWPTKVLHG